MLCPLLLTILPACAQEQPIATAPEDLDLGGAITVFAAGGSAAAMILSVGAEDDRSWRLWHNGTSGPEWDYLDGLRFSADGQHSCYRAGKRDGPETQTWYVFHDDEQGKPYSWVGMPTLRPDGKEVAYWAAEGVTHRGEREVGRSTGLTPALSPPGREGGDYFVVKGYKKGKEYQPGRSAPPPVYRADGKDLAYRGAVPKGWLILVGRKEHGPYLQATPPQWSPSGKHLTWSGVPLSGQGRIYAGRKELAKGSPALGQPVVSSDGKHLAWPARRDDDLVVVVDEMVVSGPFGRIGRLTLAPKGTSVAFIATEGERSTSISSNGDTDILDAMEVEDDFGFWRGGGGAWRLVINENQVGKEWDYLGQPVFSADGKRIAVEARKDEDWYMLLAEAAEPEQDPWQSERFDAVGEPRFVKGEVRFGARRGRELVQIRATGTSEGP